MHTHKHARTHARTHAQETAELRIKLDNSQGDVRSQLKTKDDKISEILEELASINALYNELKDTTSTVGGGRTCVRLGGSQPTSL